MTRRGCRLKPKRLSGLVRRYVDRAAIGKSGACHLFRHTMATLMLEGGADVRHIQEILGHRQFSTTLALHAPVDREAPGDPPNDPPGLATALPMPNGPS